jgi:hypothetical protein
VEEFKDMKKRWLLGCFSTSCLLLGVLAACQGGDTVAPTIESVTGGDSVYVGDAVTFEVAAEDDVTAIEDLTYKVIGTLGEESTTVDGLTFTFAEVGDYDVEVQVIDEAGNVASKELTVTSHDLTYGWKDEEVQLFADSFGQVIPFARSLSDGYTVEETTSMDGEAGVYVSDEECGDISAEYGETLLAAGFTYSEERSGDLYGTFCYMYDYHQEDETNDRKVLSIQVDYYAGSESGEYPAAFEITVTYYIYPVVEESTTRDADFVSSALQSEDLGALVPEFKVTSEDRRFVFKDYHEYMGFGYCYIDIYGGTLEDAATYIDDCTTAGLYGGIYEDFAGDSEYTSVYDENFALIYMQIENYLMDDDARIVLEIMSLSY